MITELRKLRIRFLRERRDHAVAMLKLRRTLGVGFAVGAVLAFLLIVVL
jgi:hypothetical protein